MVLFALFWLARRMVHSPFGLSLRGIHQNVFRMPALGTPVKARLIGVYTLGAAYAGIAGALLTQTTQFVSIDVLSFNRSAELILVLGGTGSLYGALLGTLVFMTAHHMLSGINPQYWQFWLGILLIFCRALRTRRHHGRPAGRHPAPAGRPGMNHVLQTRNLVKKFGGFVATDD